MNAVVRENQDLEREVGFVEGGAPPMALMSAISKAELDQQITTAHAFPRSIKKFRNECMDMACLSEQVASECYYVLPRGGKNIEGPSVRLGEIVLSAWGNSQAGARVVDIGEDFITAQGVFFDLERNVKVTMEVQRRITDKDGRRYKDDMIGVTGNAACSIALRNAIFRGIPKAFWNDIYLAARKTAAGDIKSLVTNRTEALNYCARKGVTQAVVLAALGVPGVEDIGLDELATLRGMLTAIKDEGISIEVAFAAKDAPATKKPETKQPRAKADKKPKADVHKGTDVSAPSGTAAAASGDPAPAATVDAKTSQKPALINQKQLDALIDKADAEGIPTNAICAKFEIGVLADLPADKFDAAIRYLDTVNAPQQ